MKTERFIVSLAVQPKHPLLRFSRREVQRQILMMLAQRQPDSFVVSAIKVRHRYPREKL